jgi:pimeloyl-ACP methyl ester carboxylesterase
MRLLTAACLAALAATPALAQFERRQLPRPDGTLIGYSVDVPPGLSDGLLFLAQGSGCLPTESNAHLATVRRAFPQHIVIQVEKYGVAPEASITDGFTDCPPEFHAGYTVSGRVSDYETVLAEVRVVGQPLILFGGSEGGLAVAMLAARVDADAAVLLSCASGIGFADMVLSTIPPEGQEQVRAGLVAASLDPEGTALFAGSSHRFWADIMRHVPVDYMLASDTPFLVIQGGLDKSSPVAAARAAADRFAAAGKASLTYWEFPALDHGMVDPVGQSHLADIAAAAAKWAANIGGQTARSAYGEASN